jgi:hypothetical protein
MDNIKEVALRKIDKLITIKADNTIANHFKYAFKYYYDRRNENILGQTSFGSFVLWQYNYFWGSIFYPVIYGRFIFTNNKFVLILKTRLNIIGKIFNGILIAMISYGLLPNCFIVKNNLFLIDFPELILSIILIIGLQIVPFVAYWTTKKSSIRFIKEYLNKDDFCE